MEDSLANTYYDWMQEEYINKKDVDFQIKFFRNRMSSFEETPNFKEILEIIEKLNIEKREIEKRINYYESRISEFKKTRTNNMSDDRLSI